MNHSVCQRILYVSSDRFSCAVGAVPRPQRRATWADRICAGAFPVTQHLQNTYIEVFRLFAMVVISGNMEASCPIFALNQFTYKGTGPRYYKVGKYRRFKPLEVLAWLNAHPIQGTP